MKRLDLGERLLPEPLVSLDRVWACGIHRRKPPPGRPICEEVHFSEGEFSPVVPFDFGGSSVNGCGWVRLDIKAPAGIADVGHEATGYGITPSRLKLAPLGKLMRKRLPSDVFVTHAHHDDDAARTLVLANQLELIQAANFLMRASTHTASAGIGGGHHGRREVPRAPSLPEELWQFRRFLSVPLALRGSQNAVGVCPIGRCPPARSPIPRTRAEGHCYTTHCLVEVCLNWTEQEAGGKGCFPYLGDAATAKHEALVSVAFISESRTASSRTSCSIVPESSTFGWCLFRGSLRPQHPIGLHCLLAEDSKRPTFTEDVHCFPSAKVGHIRAES